MNPLFRELLDELRMQSGSPCGLVAALHRPSPGAWAIDPLAVVPPGTATGVLALDASVFELEAFVEAAVRDGVHVLAPSPEPALRGAATAPAAPFQSLVVLPFGRHGEITGLLCLGNRPGGYPPEVIDLVRRRLFAAALLVGARSRQDAAAEALREAKEIAERGSRAKTDFLANMSHEIRTPLNAIVGVADLLSESRLEPEQSQYVDMFRRAGSTLLALVNNVLDLSKIEAGQLEIEAIPFDLREIVSQAMDAVALRAYAKGLEVVGYVRPPAPVGLVGDPTRLRQVLINLLSNAIKFTERGEVLVRVELERDTIEPGRLMFTVQDTGIGIPDDKLGSVFERFTQVDSSTARTHGGSGLGLAICRSLVGLMGGRMWVESRPGEGTTFRFTARFEVDSAASGPPSPRVPGQRACRILVVDEHRRTHDVLRELSVAASCEVASALEAASARTMMAEAVAEGRPYQLVLIDTRTVREDARDIFRWLTAAGQTAESCVLMLPTDAGTKEIAAAHEAGFASYVLKPLTPLRVAEVFSLVRRARGRAARVPRSVWPAPLLAGKTRKLLLVEDHPDNRAIVMAYLARSPFEVTAAENGQVALEMVKRSAFDIVLMDIQMPVMDGHEATRRIRAWERESGRFRAPIIALTANALKEEIESTREAGCDSHLTKPIRKQTLLRAISEITATADLLTGAGFGAVA